MVQVINDPHSGNVFGRLGKGIGQGLSEQVPKEIERSRLASGLKKFEKDYESENLSPVQQYARLAAIPGMTSDNLYNISSLLRQDTQRRNFLNRGSASAKGGQAPSQDSQNPSQEGQKPAERMVPASASVQENGFASPSQITSYKKSLLQEPSQAEINDLAKDFLNQGIVLEPSEAVNLAKQELGQNKQSQKLRNAEFNASLTKRLSKDLQGNLEQGDYKDLAGEIQNSLLDQGEYMVNKLGMTPEEATENISRIGLELGKSLNTLKESGSFSNMFKSSKSKITDLRNQKKIFDNYGFGELFDDNAASTLGITPLQAAHVLDPLKNKSIIEEISNLKNVRARQHGAQNREMKPAILDSIIRKITPKDNLYDIEYLLREKGYDVNQFKSRLSEIEDAKELSLTPQQKRQQNRPISNSLFGDLLFQIF